MNKTTSLGTVIGKQFNGMDKTAIETAQKQRLAKRFPLLAASPNATHRIWLIEGLGFAATAEMVEREVRLSLDKITPRDMDKVSALLDNAESLKILEWLDFDDLRDLRETESNALNIGLQ